MEETQIAQRHAEQVRRVGGGIWDNGLGRAQSSLPVPNRHKSVLVPVLGLSMEISSPKSPKQSLKTSLSFFF